MFNGKLVSKLKSFRNDSKGSIATAAGLMCIPLILGVGISVDVVRAVQLRSALYAALDAASLAAAASPTLTQDERRKTATDVLNANLKLSGIAIDTIKPKVGFDGDTIQVRAEMKMPTTLMGLAGIDELDVSSEVAASIAQNKTAEIALVLDYSGSMKDPVAGQTKYIAMRDAAIGLINNMIKIDPKKVKFALVPFSHHVRTTLPSEMVVDANGSTWTGCTQDRPYPSNVNVAAPTYSDDTKWGQEFDKAHKDKGCDGYEANNLSVVPLTNKFDKLKKQLEDMTPYAWTHIALGVEFGFHMLMPGLPFEAQPLNLEDNKKFMVVLTDGAQTEPAFGPDGVRDVAQGGKNLLELCTNAKAEGITIITIAFDLDDSDTRKNLKACASGDSNAFVADDKTDLVTAFNAFRVLVLSEVYLSK